MDLWKILIVGFGTLLTLVVTFAIKPAFRVGVEFTSLKNSIETLTNSINSLVKSLEKLDKKNEEDHKDIFEQLQDHHDRLIIMERSDSK